jgi:phenylpropionate dioxygenase-like ring-hydroxylating dioxygenase large terminal subunit
MLRETQVELARRVLGYIDNRTTQMNERVYLNDVSTYTSLEQASLERQKFFREMPQFFTMSCQLPNPGDYFSDDLGGVPILAVRGKDGVARAFLNVCRHRGAKVASGTGKGQRAFVCPYHGWTYNTEGGLVALTPPGGFDGLTCAERSLTPLPLAEAHGMIWVRPSPGADFDMDEMLGGLAPELANYDMGSFVPYKSGIISKPMNWKLVIDTFLETWHVATLHKATVAPIFQPNVNAYDAFGRNGRLIIPRRSFKDMKGMSDEEFDVPRHSAIVYTLFPNTLMVWQGKHLETWRSFPAGDGANQCVTEATLYLPKQPETEKEIAYGERNMKLLLDTVEQEDFPVATDIHMGAHTPAQAYTTFGRNEPGLQHYHRSVREALGLPDPANAA